MLRDMKIYLDILNNTEKTCQRVCSYVKTFSMERVKLEIEIPKDLLNSRYIETYINT